MSFIRHVSERSTPLTPNQGVLEEKDWPRIDDLFPFLSPSTLDLILKAQLGTGKILLGVPQRLLVYFKACMLEYIVISVSISEWEHNIESQIWEEFEGHFEILATLRQKDI